MTVAALIRARLLRAFGRSPDRRGAFIRGDASGSVIENAETDADTFIAGDRTGSVIRNVTHRPH
jgi:hypothetical protein